MKKLLLFSLVLYSIPAHTTYDTDPLLEKKRSHMPLICHSLQTIMVTAFLSLATYGGYRLYTDGSTEVNDMKESCATCSADMQGTMAFIQNMTALFKKCPLDALELGAHVAEFIKNCCD